MLPDPCNHYCAITTKSYDYFRQLGLKPASELPVLLEHCISTTSNMRSRINWTEAPCLRSWFACWVSGHRYSNNRMKHNTIVNIIYTCFWFTKFNNAPLKLSGIAFNLFSVYWNVRSCGGYHCNVAMITTAYSILKLQSFWYSWNEVLGLF